jgi:hypothetical protein
MLQSQFAKIFYEKFDEVENKIALLYAYKKQDHTAIRKYNEKLFGAINEDQVLQSHNLMHFRDPLMHQKSELIDMVAVRDMIRDVFSRYGIRKYNVVLDSSLL